MTPRVPTIHRGLALALLLLLSLGQTAAAVALYRCGGVVRTSCCCPERDGRDETTISRKSCCDVSVVAGESRKPDFQLSASPSEFAPTEVVVAVAEVSPPVVAPVAPGNLDGFCWAAHAPPLVLTKHSRLI